MLLIIKIFFSIFLLYPSFIQSANKTIDTSIYYTDSPLKDFKWCGGAQKTSILVLSEKGTIYKSINKGKDWQKISSKLELPAYDQNGNKQAKIVELESHPSDPSFLIFKGSQPSLNWLSQDCGETFKLINQPLNELVFHPLEKSWMLAAAWRTCQAEPCHIYKELFVSFDFGAKWKMIEDYVVQFAWGKTNETFSEVPKERILLSHDPDGSGSQSIDGWSSKIHLTYSDDFFKTFKKIVNFGNKFLIADSFLYVAFVQHESSQDVSLKVTNANSKNYVFKDVVLPFKRMSEHSYHLLDSSEGQVFFQINHYGENAKFGNIYGSDSSGVYFNLILEHNARDANSVCEFDRVQGIEGIYIANGYDSETVDLVRGSESSGMRFETSFSKRQKERSKRVFEEIENYKQTKITFDKGGSWSFIPPPLVDSEGKPWKCKDSVHCGLHLYSINSDRFGMIYSSENSLGLVIGTGNVGSALSSKVDEINTYLSRDGGVTWFEIAKGSHIYEFGDHGGLLVLASDQGMTSSLLYSINEGLTFSKLDLSDAFEIENIITEPSNLGLHFLIYGEKNGKGVLVGIDFNGIMERECKKGDEWEGDYELWNPRDGRAGGCLLGRKTKYHRRKREAECFNAETFERPIFSTNCECTMSDYECDVGYKKTGGGYCVPDENLHTLNKDHKNCDGIDFESQGYRKVPGDSCIGGIDLNPRAKSCKLYSSKWVSPFFFGYFAYGLIIVLFVVVGFFVLRKWLEKRQKRSEERNEFDRVLGTVEEGGIFDD